jgi:membrane protease YdiL (CAAX protease family)
MIFELCLAAAGGVALWALWKADVIRPGSFRRRGLRDTGPSPWWAWGIGAVTTFLFGNLGASLAHAAVSSRPHTDLELTAALIFGSGIAGTIAALWVLAQVSRRHPREWVRGLGGSIRRGLVGLLAAYPIVTMVSILVVLVILAFGGELPDQLAHDTLKQLAENRDSPMAWATVVGVVLLAPVVEELTFRVFFQTMLLRAIGSAWLAVLVTSLIFALVHLGSGVSVEDAHALVPLFVLSLGLGIAYERTGRAAVPIVMHMGFNALNIIMAAALVTT